MRKLGFRSLIYPKLAHKSLESLSASMQKAALLLAELLLKSLQALLQFMAQKDWLG